VADYYLKEIIFKIIKFLSNIEIFKLFIIGEMAERLNAAVLKTVIPGNRDRGFESLSLRQATAGTASSGISLILMR
jgi:hypothetical protein